MVLDATHVYGTIGGIFVLQVATFIYFLSSIDPKYIKTFYSMQSSNDYARRIFLDKDEDERKIVIFEDNRNKWKKIEAGGVKWVGEKIPEWNEEQPDC
ncbi:hypothetical protein TrLO_g3629 [Triparma laevis f. longispina]|uniref:Uncharacterized protein n=1 Tax=Triparma laevis f. longispina TaxID=1714387 RepID=A0A9W7FSX6_9STRA|nr:hypothetical protein TrLO_g3629 [Triparma laevis f. longispina]